MDIFFQHETYFCCVLLYTAIVTVIRKSEIDSKSLRIKFSHYGKTWNGKIGPHAYSSVPNRRACTFNIFEKKIPPAWSYLGLHVYCFWEKIPPARLFSCIFIAICHARLLILRKKFPLHGLIWPCTFIVFEKKKSPCTFIFLRL